MHTHAVNTHDPWLLQSALDAHVVEPAGAVSQNSPTYESAHTQDAESWSMAGVQVPCAPQLIALHGAFWHVIPDHEPWHEQVPLVHDPYAPQFMPVHGSP